MQSHFLNLQDACERIQLMTFYKMKIVMMHGKQDMCGDIIKLYIWGY